MLQTASDVATAFAIAAVIAILAWLTWPALLFFAAAAAMWGVSVAIAASIPTAGGG